MSLINPNVHPDIGLRPKRSTDDVGEEKDDLAEYLKVSTTFSLTVSYLSDDWIPIKRCSLSTVKSHVVAKTGGTKNYMILVLVLLLNGLISLYL